MRSSTVISLLSAAALASASPVHQALHKKAIVYDIVTDIVYVTVTEGLPTPSPEPVHSQKHHSFSAQAPSSTPVYVAPPPTTTIYVAPPTSTPVYVAPAPTTTSVYVAPPVSTTPVVVVPSTPSTSAAAASSSPVSDDSFTGIAVDNHNVARQAHQAPTAVWNQTLADWAMNTAQSCVFAHDMSQGGGGYGQNIAAQGDSNSDGYDLNSGLNSSIASWYNEESLYNSYYGQSAPSEPSGVDFLHFTQMVWVDSGSVGCATVSCGTGSEIFSTMYSWFTVCNYYPVGNVEGAFNTNVLPSN